MVSALSSGLSGLSSSLGGVQPLPGRLYVVFFGVKHLCYSHSASLRPGTFLPLAANLMLGITLQ